MILIILSGGHMHWGVKVRELIGLMEERPVILMATVDSVSLLAGLGAGSVFHTDVSLFDADVMRGGGYEGSVLLGVRCYLWKQPENSVFVMPLSEYRALQTYAPHVAGNVDSVEICGIDTLCDVLREARPDLTTLARASRRIEILPRSMFFFVDMAHMIASVLGYAVSSSDLDLVVSVMSFLRDNRVTPRRVAEFRRMYWEYISESKRRKAELIGAAMACARELTKPELHIRVHISRGPIAKLMTGYAGTVASYIARSTGRPVVITYRCWESCSVLVMRSPQPALKLTDYLIEETRRGGGYFIPNESRTAGAGMIP